MALLARLTPSRFRAPHGAKVFEVSWADGTESRLSHRLLRGYCPCAGCQGHGATISFLDGGSLELRALERVGNYALSLTWGDGHASGIYSFEYLRRLADLASLHGEDELSQLTHLPPAPAPPPAS